MEKKTVLSSPVVLVVGTADADDLPCFGGQAWVRGNVGIHSNGDDLSLGNQGLQIAGFNSLDAKGNITIIEHAAFFFCVKVQYGLDGLSLRVPAGHRENFHGVAQ